MSDITRALIYAITVGYYARLTDRLPFVEKIVPQFTAPYTIPGNSLDKQTEVFINCISRCGHVQT